MKKLLTIILTLGIVYGCSEGFTEIDPKGSLNAGLLSNEDGVDLLLAGAYAMLTGQRVRGFCKFILATMLQPTYTLPRMISQVFGRK